MSRAADGPRPGRVIITEEQLRVRIAAMGRGDRPRLRGRESRPGRRSPGRLPLHGGPDPGDSHRPHHGLHRPLELRERDLLVRPGAARVGSVDVDRGPPRPDRRGHRGHRADPGLPEAQPGGPASAKRARVRPGRQDRAAASRGQRSTTSASRFPTCTWWGTDSTTVACSGTSRTWPCWRACDSRRNATRHRRRGAILATHESGVQESRPLDGHRPHRHPPLHGLPGLAAGRPRAAEFLGVPPRRRGRAVWSPSRSGATSSPTI